MDLGLLLIPSLAFGLVVTSHVALSGLLLSRKPRWRALIAFLFPPLAFYWGWVEGFRLWSSLWLFGLVLYVVGFAAASAGV